MHILYIFYSKQKVYNRRGDLTLPICYHSDPDQVYPQLLFAKEKGFHWLNWVQSGMWILIPIIWFHYHFGFLIWDEAMWDAVPDVQ